MSGVSRKRGLDAGDNEEAKVRKEDEQLLRETEPFDSIDDVTLELRLIEDYVGRVKEDTFRNILDRLDKSDTLVRKKQGQAVASEPDHHIIYKEDITEFRRLIEDHVSKVSRAKFEEQLERIVSGDRIVRRQADNGQDSIAVLDTVDTPQQHEPLQNGLQPPQANEQSAEPFAEHSEVIDSNPDAQNINASDAKCKTVLPGFSNELKNIAQINFYTQLLKRLGQPLNMKRNEVAIEELCGIIKQRTALIESAQYQYSPTDQQQFNQELLPELQALKLRSKSKLRYDIQELVNMQSDALEYPFCPFVKYLSDFDLIKCIMSNSDSQAAEYILHARKLQLRKFSIESNLGIMELNLIDSVLEENDNSSGIDYPAYRKFQYCMEVNKVDAMDLFRLLKIIVKFYDVSKAKLTLEHDGSNTGIIYHLLESTFGAPPTDPSEKIRVCSIYVETPEMVHFLRWFCTVKLSIDCDLGVLVDEPSLMSGVDRIVCSGINTDGFMENFKSRGICLFDKSEWSPESIFRVLTAHRLSGDTGCRRTIAYLRYRGTGNLESWKEIFESWSRGFEEEYGNIGRRVTLSTQCVGRYDSVGFDLH